ncbi:Uncharacterized protein C19orf18 [Lemmus lemmus]
MFLFWFLLECLLHVCLPYADGIYPAGKAMGSPASNTPVKQPAPVEQPRDNTSVLKSTPGTTTVIPRRPGLVHIISISSIAFVIALICGLMISYMIHRLAKAEEKQQLAMLYENVEIPLLEEKEVSEDEGQDESSKPFPESEELRKFIGSGVLSC